MSDIWSTVPRARLSIEEQIEVDRWLAEHDREVRESVLRESGYEYAAGYQGDTGIELRWFSLSGTYVVREAAEHDLAKYDGEPSVRLVRRPRPGPWEPVEPQSADVCPTCGDPVDPGEAMKLSDGSMRQMDCADGYSSSDRGRA